ncbi:MAG: nitrile hydratase [Hyphomicrobiaceae bacterium]|jgi:nitrile hydratase
MHDHHDHDLTFQADHDTGPASPYEVLEHAIRELLVEKGVLTNAEISEHINKMATRNETLGAKVTARAWTDPEFKQRYLNDTRAALASMNIDIGDMAEYRVVENTPRIHNVIICTLCSCYPKLLLGYPPSWYKSVTYRSRTVREPRAVLQEFGVELPDGVEVRVHDSTADLRYIVLPMQPEETTDWPAEKLMAKISRDSLIGTAIPT